VSAKGLIFAAGGAAAAVAAAAAGYFYLVKDKITDTSERASVADPAAFEGEDVEDALNVESPPGDISDTMPQVEGDPWLDPEAVDETGEPVEGSGDFVEGEEPFEDVYAPEGSFDRGSPPPSDPIDPSEAPADPPAEAPASAEPEPAEPQR